MDITTCTEVTIKLKRYIATLLAETGKDVEFVALSNVATDAVHAMLRNDPGGTGSALRQFARHV
jgi:hypothetical protein